MPAHKRAAAWQPGPAATALAALLDLWLYLGLAITRTGRLDGYLADATHVLLSALFLVVAWAVLALLVTALFGVLDRLAEGSGTASHEPRPALSIAVFVVLLACWTPYLVVSFPGLINFDYFNELNQFVGARPLSNHHPIAMTYVFGALYELGHLFGGATGGLFLTVMVQALCLDGLLTYAHRWLCRMGVRRGIRVALVAFCALCPILPLYACILTKDTLSATALGLFALMVAVRMWCERTGQRVPRMATLPVIATMGVVTSLTRANCVYLVAGTLLVALFRLRGTSRLRMVGAIALVLACYLGWTNAVVPALGASASDTALVISIPLQQTGAYARYAPEDATAGEIAAIEGILSVSYDEVGSLYTPNIVDPLQSVAKSADDHDKLAAYLGAWVSQGLRHPGIYANALLCQNVGYWYPGLTFDEIQDLDYTQNTPLSHYVWMQGMGYSFPGDLADLGTVTSPFENGRAMLQQFLMALADMPILGLVLQPAFYTWTCLIVGLWDATRHRSALPLFALAVLLFLVECVSPLAASLRYALPLVVLTPVLMGCSLAREAPAPERRTARG